MKRFFLLLFASLVLFTGCNDVRNGSDLKLLVELSQNMTDLGISLKDKTTTVRIEEANENGEKIILTKATIRLNIEKTIDFEDGGFLIYGELLDENHLPTKCLDLVTTTSNGRMKIYGISESTVDYFEFFDVVYHSDYSREFVTPLRGVLQPGMLSIESKIKKTSKFRWISWGERLWESIKENSKYILLDCESLPRSSSLREQLGL